MFGLAIHGGAGFRKLGALGQEAVTRMNRIGASLDAHADDVLDVEIGVDRALSAAHQIALVGFGPMQREPVFLRVNGDGANAELSGGTHDTNGYFTAIRDEEALEGPRLGKWIHR